MESNQNEVQEPRPHGTKTGKRADKSVTNINSRKNRKLRKKGGLQTRFSFREGTAAGRSPFTCKNIENPEFADSFRGYWSYNGIENLRHKEHAGVLIEMDLDLVLDTHMKEHGIMHIGIIKNKITILAHVNNEEKLFRIDIGQTPEETARFVEEQLDIPLGRKLCQGIIIFICKPENWEVISTSEEQLKQKKQEERYKPKQNFDDLEQWQVAVESAYHNLHKVVVDNKPQAWPAIEFILSIKAILHIQEITLPYIGIILGPPAGVKTLALRLLNGRNYTFFTDRFNPHAMVSHVANLPSGMKDGDQHMLNRMKNSFVIAPELASLLSGREEEVRENIQLMTRVADGEGLETDSGLGHKGVTGKVMFVMGGAFVEFSPRVYAMLTTFGAKLYFFRLPEVKKTRDQCFAELKGEAHIVKFQRMKVAMNQYLDIFESCPIAEPEQGLSYNLPKISLDRFRINESDDAIRIIVHLGELLGRLRLVTWTKEFTTSTKKTTEEQGKTETIETEETDFSFNTSLLEDQSRANQQHYNLALGHALSMGRTSIGMEDIPLIVRVTLSTAPQNRHRLFEQLLKSGGIITTRETQDTLLFHRNTAKRTMTELVAVGLAHGEKVGEEHSDAIVLEDEFNFFIGSEFEEARHDNYSRYGEYLNSLNKSENEEKSGASE